MKLLTAITTVCFSAAAALAGPIIGITTTFQGDDANPALGKAQVNMSYVESVREQGATPLLIPPGASAQEIAEFVELCDGFLFIGGLDIPPEAYGEVRHETVAALPSTRFLPETLLMETVLDGQKPILGVCLGSQMMTVVTGGSLIQDIPSEVGDTTAHRGTTHDVEVVPGTRLAEILAASGHDGGPLNVNSYHHQASDVLGEGFVVAARAPDGVTEAIEIPGPRFVLGVQWHPERSSGIDHNAIFDAFITAVEETVEGPAESKETLEPAAGAR